MNRGIAGGATTSGAVLVAALLSGCVSTHLEYRDPSIDMATADRVRAVVDADSGSVVLPLDDYFFTPAQVTDATQLTEYAIADCMADAGFADEPTLYPRSDEEGGGSTSVAFLLSFDTMLIWREAQLPGLVDAGTSGASTDVSAQDAVEEQRSEQGDTWREREAQCSLSEQLETYLPFADPSRGDLPPGLALVQAGVQGSAEYVRSTGEYEDLAAEFRTCLEKEGAGSQGDWTSDRLSGDDFSAEVRCHTELGTIQQLADLAASYQEAYIKKYPSEFAAAMAAKDELAESYAEQLARRSQADAE